MKNSKYIILALALPFIFAPSCTNLDETTYGLLSPDTYYQNESEALSSVVGVYNRFNRFFQGGGDSWRNGVYGTDELFCPGKASGGWYDEGVDQIMTHNCNPDNARLNGSWNSMFQLIGAANTVIESLEASPKAAEYTGLIAECRALRGFGYWKAMDQFGNVPIHTAARVDSNDLPKTAPRKEVFDFVVTEFTEAIAALPSVTSVDRSAYYPRITKEGAMSMLAEIYLNAEIYAGEKHYDDCLKLCNDIINTGAFGLEPKVGDCFLSTNENNHEVLVACAVDPFKSVDGNQFILYAQPGFDQQRYGLSFAPANGYMFDHTALNRFEEGDERLELLQYGLQYKLDGTPLCDESGKQYELVDIHDMTRKAVLDDEGYRVLKYSPVGASFQGANGDNDYVAERYSDILLMKAECIFRASGATAEALAAFNQVRVRSELEPATTLSLASIEKERANEFIWEGNKRRQDMIRFGSYFNTTWCYKQTLEDPVKDAWKGIYPIPRPQLTANPNLKQNPGYENM